MRIAIVSDIHSNWEALKAVLGAIEEQGGVDNYLFAGDLFGYGSDPVKCTRKMRNLPIRYFVLGNHDEAVVQAIENPNSILTLGIKQQGGALAAQRKGFPEGIHLALKQIYNNYDPVDEKDFENTVKGRQETIDLVKNNPKPEIYHWLKSRKRAILVPTNIGDFIIVHSNPINLKDDRCVVGPFDNKREQYVKRGLAYDVEDVLRQMPNLYPNAVGCICGDTHIPGKYERDGIIVVNPGSVGIPRQKGAKITARYAIMDTNHPGPLHEKIRLFEAHYDWRKTQQKMIENGLKDKFAEVLQ
ncbi:metallophosphoesterase family protein [Candidatus Woesearchaeota archaeon]|nr:metallophosphoesterase family protein [Candidatus Woesearchaeota archaeon]